MRNCLKCSSYDSFEKWCNYHGKRVSPTDTCDAADINGGWETLGETCSSCRHFSSGMGAGGYCRYHRTSTQSSNGCCNYDTGHSETSDSASFNSGGGDDPSIMPIIIGVIVLLVLADMLLSWITTHLHISLPIIIMIVSIVIWFFRWANAPEDIPDRSWRKIFPVAIALSVVSYFIFSKP